MCAKIYRTVGEDGIVKILFEPRGKQAAAVNASTTTVNQPSSSSPDLKKFHIHFRRTDDYEGAYGFDWLRDEYIYPIVNVTHDNSSNPTLNAATALCLNVAQIKREYKTTGVLNPVSPYGQDYYPAWLSIFPHTTTAQFPHGSTMHANGVDLKLEIEELETLVSDATKITFEPSSVNIVISPSEIDLQSLVGNSNSKTYGNGNNGLIANQKVNVKCVDAPLTRHEEIKVFAELGARREEVGKLMLYKNNVIPKAEMVVVNVITDNTTPSLSSDYQFALKRQSFNQALVRADVLIDTTFNLYEMSRSRNRLNYSFTERADMIALVTGSTQLSTNDIKSKIVSLYEKYGRYKPPRGWFGLRRGEINPTGDSGNNRTYMFYTNLNAGNVQGSCSVDANGYWGNSYILFKSGLPDNFTLIHEAGHSFGLPHVFQMGALAGPHKFYHGYTDNVMDYDWQMGPPSVGVGAQPTSTGPNRFMGKTYSFCKWQWEIIRNDRSLITDY